MTSTRGGGNIQGDSGFAKNNRDESRIGLDNQRNVAGVKVEGWINMETAAKVHCVTTAVEQNLKGIRGLRAGAE